LTEKNGWFKASSGLSLFLGSRLVNFSRRSLKLCSFLNSS
jgi:hypothetical protein